MNSDWRNEPATDEQKGKLRFFGCTWDDGITAGQADDALKDCARQFPDAEVEYQKNQPATEMQKEKLRFFGCTWNGEITVGIHQILSFLKQTGGMPAANLYRALCQRGPFRSVNQKQFEALLRSLAENDLIEQVPQGSLILGLLGERITARFDFYVAFQTTEEFVIRCGQEDIGKLPETFIPPVGESMMLAGKRWLVTEIIFDKKLVLVVNSPGKKPTRFGSAFGEIHTRVMQEMKSVLMDDDELACLDPSSKKLLRAARQTACIVRLDTTDVVFCRQSIQWFPWVGTRAMRTLSLFASSAKIACDMDKLSITYRLSSPEEFYAHLREITKSNTDAVALARLMPNKTVEKFDEFAPEQLLDEANAKSRLNVSEARAACEATLAGS